MQHKDTRAWLDEIKARADAATEGPWSVHRSERTGTYVTRPDLLGIAREWSLVWQDGDAEFIAHARTDVDDMAAALTAVLNLLDKVDDECEITTQADGVHVPVYLVRRAITDELATDHPAQSERH